MKANAMEPTKEFENTSDQQDNIAEDPPASPTINENLGNQQTKECRQSKVTSTSDDWTTFTKADQVAVWRKPLWGTGMIDTVMPDGSAAWVSLDHGLGRILLVAGQDEIHRIAK